jgi:hypothetical protein
MPALFPPTWFASGVVTAESAADFEEYAAGAPERPVRHWRWAAFRDWAEEHEPLAADECRTAYALGEAEPDATLGTAIMCHVLFGRNCPADLREKATRSDRAAVRRMAGIS